METAGRVPRAESSPQQGGGGLKETGLRFRCGEAGSEHAHVGVGTKKQNVSTEKSEDRQR